MSDTENIVRDIFGESDESDAEFEGFDNEKDDEGITIEKAEENKDLDFSDSELGGVPEEKAKEIIPEISDSDDSDDDALRADKSQMVYDFDIMIQRRKEMNSRRRRGKNVDIINDSDDEIAELIMEMKRAAEDDFEYNRNKMTAINKLTLLPKVEANLKKIRLREAFLDLGILNVLTVWLTKLPNGSLPHLEIREKLLKILKEFNIDDIDLIKSSGIGKAVMYLFKHPKETKENKKLASQLISAWSRPIFNLETDFHSISRDERVRRDLEHMTKFKRRQSDAGEGSSSKVAKTDQKILKPGDKGWIPRARVPMPSMKDYVIRPKSNIDVDLSRTSLKKPIGRFEKHLRNFREMKKLNKMNRAVPISIEGRKMGL